MAGEGLIGLGQALAGGAAGYVSGLDEQRKYEIEKQDSDIRKTMADIHLGNYQMQKTAFDEKMATQKAGEGFFLALSDTAEDEGRYASKASDVISAMKGGVRTARPSTGGAPVPAVAGSSAKPIGIMTNGKEPKGFAALDPNAMVSTSDQYLARYSTMRDKLNQYMEKLKAENPQLATQTRLSPQYQDYVNRMGSLVNVAEELRGAAAVVAHGKTIKGYLRAVQTGDAVSQAKYRSELSTAFGEEFPVITGMTENTYLVQPFYEVEEAYTDPVSGKSMKRVVRKPMDGIDGGPSTIEINKEVIDSFDPEIDPQKAFEIQAELRKALQVARIQTEGSARVASIGAESESYVNTDELYLRASRQGKDMNVSDEAAAYAEAETDLSKAKDEFLKRRLPKPDSIQGMSPTGLANASAAAEAAWNATEKAAAAEEIARKWGFKKSGAGGGFYGWSVKSRNPNAASLVDRVSEILPRSRSSKRGSGAGLGVVPKPSAGLGAGNPTGIPVD